MARRIINPKWAENMEDRIANGASIDETTQYNILIQWIILALSSRNIPYKVYTLGAGVKRITTKVEECPLCKRKLV